MIRTTLALGMALAVAAPATHAANPAAPTAAVECGIDVLTAEAFAPLVGRKVGLITNHTGVDRQGRSTIELLHAAPGVQLVALFSPEHGLKGELDERVSDSKDPLTGLHVYSLYGDTRRPTDEMLEGVDTIVFDIQDIGTRFYTYIATMGYAMEEAAKRGLRMVVLDRPNPITGTRVFGPLPDREGQFTCYHRIPLVHGMTVGELARMFNEERRINADLVVVPLRGWRRSMWFDETGLVWIDPSPNMRTLNAATLYPAVGLSEACKLSVGRGTDAPFEWFGAPWVRPQELAAALHARMLAGVRFVPTYRSPDSSKYRKQRCGGVQVIITDRDAFEPVEAGLAIATTLEALAPNEFDGRTIDKLLINTRLAEKAEQTPQPRRYSEWWDDELNEFMARRAKFLMYE